MSAVSLLVEKISAHFGQLCTRSAQNGYFSNSTTNPRVLGGPNLPRFGGHQCKQFGFVRFSLADGRVR
jgi:hypothetical protein